MSIVLSQRSLSRLEGVHPDLVRVVKKAAALSSLDFTVLEGLRTEARQKQLMKQGATRTMTSRHLAMMVAAANWNTTRPFVETILKGGK